MLATPWPAPFDDEDWWFELKWDGYRCVARAERSGLRMWSRRGLDLGDRFHEVAALRLPEGWVFDGEVIAFDEAGRPDFQLLQAGEPATYVIFDVLESPAGPLVSAPIEERKGALEELKLGDRVLVDRPIRGSGIALYDAVRERDLEGIVAKRAQSRYQPGRRSPDWRKVALRRTMRAVVGGWLPGDGGRRGTFGSLLVGLWDGPDLRWAGAVGSGFDDRTLRRLGEIIAGIERATPPFVDTSSVPRGARWCEPVVNVFVEYKEWTRDRRLRAPVFKGIDLDPAPPLWEEEGPDQADF